MYRVTNVPIVQFNPHLICKLCGGYLIDATTIIECLHSFCRSCIVSYLKFHITCPVCDTLLHKTRPQYAIRPDRVLQAIVYKLIPNLFEKEMSRRRSFYDMHPQHSRSLSPEKRGDITLNAYVLQEEDRFSIELQYWNQGSKSIKGSGEVAQLGDTQLPYTPKFESISQSQSTFLLCPPELTVGHLEKLICMKFNLKPGDYQVAVFFSSDDSFSPDYTLSDLACLYAWRRQQPLKLYFNITENKKTHNSQPLTDISSKNSFTEKTIQSAVGSSISHLSPPNSSVFNLYNLSESQRTLPERNQSANTPWSLSNSFCKVPFSGPFPTHSIQSMGLPSAPVFSSANSVCSPLA